MFGWFERRINPYPQSEQGLPPEGLLAFCWHYSRDAAPWLLAMAVLTALISIGEVMLFGFLGSIVDWLAAADPDDFLAREGSRLAWMAALVLIGLPLAIFFDSLIVHQTLLGNYAMATRWRMHRQLLRQSLTFFSDEFAGRVATRVMQTSLSMREAVMKVLDVLVYVGVYFIAMVVMVGSSDLRLALPMLVWLAVYLALIFYFVPKLSRISEAQADARSAMTGRIVDSYTNIATVKLFSHARREENYAREGMDAFLSTVHRQMRKVTMFETLVYLNNSLLVFLVSALAIGFWLNGAVSVGAIAIAIGLALRLNGMSQWIMWEVSSLFENIGIVQDGMTMLSQPQEVVDLEGAGALRPARGEIRFDHVRFHYGKAHGVIEDLSLTVQPGEKVGLVGRSGAGKTTLTNLLLRFYNLEGGRILVDGHDVAELTQESLRAAIGVVTQDTSLLHRSVRENIAYGRPEADEAEIIEAARKAKALDFIAGLADPAGRTGFDAHVGERGVKLSGGQRQRIAIARVFLKDAPILVLDEATSALDSEVEAAIQENLFDLMAGKTVIAIAHRLSTIAQMDRLVVLDQGRIVETGTHTDLIAAGGLYSELWARQSGGFINDSQAAAAAR
ncbi:ABC transporter ATP-binding protein [Pseudohoeflea coraliihabitans]|uniref:ABC transporter ATP-binding protein n=1 Tax=Pseudohoeflea coraliihabitans TaxID=2860393 RepID=UPI00272957B3|nr:ABC transporter ATP-binding protein [Pseudohoeflea sp. DP4N28-3]